MENTRDFSSRRKFLKTSALASVSCAHLLLTHKALGDTVFTLQQERSLAMLDPDGEVRIGLIGFTGKPSSLMNAIPNIRGARLAAFALGDGERQLRNQRIGQSELDSIQAYSAFQSRTHVYPTYQEMLAKENLDVVASCLPNGLNAHASMAAAQRRFHIVSEKPMAADLKTLTALKSVINKTNVQITALLDMRQFAGVAAVRKAIADGLIGDPVLAFAEVSPNSEDVHSRNRPDGLGNPTHWFSIPGLDCLSYTTGLQITQVSALREARSAGSPATTKDNPAILLKLSNGATGVVSIGSFQPMAGEGHGDDRLRVTGTLGSVAMLKGKVQLITENHLSQELPRPPQRSVLENFVALLRGQGSQVMTADEAFEMARIGLMASQAAEEARVIFA